LAKKFAKNMVCFVFHFIIYSFSLPRTYPLRLSNAFNLDDSAIARGNRLQAGTGGHGLGQEINVHLVHGSKVLHIRQVNIVLDDLFKRGSGKFQDFLEVLEDSALYTR
jgi:hypothetical protein